jgi:hypothetical protein
MVRRIRSLISEAGSKYRVVTRVSAGVMVVAFFLVIVALIFEKAILVALLLCLIFAAHIVVTLTKPPFWKE